MRAVGNTCCRVTGPLPLLMIVQTQSAKFTEVFLLKVSADSQRASGDL